MLVAAAFRWALSPRAMLILHTLMPKVLRRRGAIEAFAFDDFFFSIRFRGRYRFSATPSFAFEAAVTATAPDLRHAATPLTPMARPVESFDYFGIFGFSL